VVDANVDHQELTVKIIMKIINLKAENIKKIKAIDITPKSSTVVVTGKNGAGKTSVLDSILFALGGKDTLKNTPRPIRDGQENAKVEVDLGDYRVVRSWTKSGGSYINVFSKEGATFPSPQALLDSIVGKISFDPLEFSRMKSEEQKSVLLDVLGLTDKVTELQKEFASKSEERRMVGRDLKTAQGHMASLSMPVGAPEKLVDTVALTDQLQSAEANNNKGLSIKAEIVNAEQEIFELQEKIKALEVVVMMANESFSKYRPVDVAPIKAQLSGASENNQKFEASREYDRVKVNVTDLEAKYRDHGVIIAGVKARKDELLTKAKLPIEGLNIDESGVTFNTIPFTQLSGAEQLKVSLAIAMASNPKLRVIRILDGSLLDDDNMKVIKEMADSQDYQIWIERVEDDGVVSIVIEDGAVK
jgi:ABC-type dipeptide/oligopeptide/nickel transport system ATPase component